MTTSEPAGTISLEEEVGRLRREVTELELERQRLELKVKVLTRQLWGRKSERHAGVDAQGTLFAEEPEPEAKAAAAGRSPVGREGRERKAKGPKPLDPALRREVVRVEAPELKDLICPETGGLMKPGFVEVLEVLARKPAEYYVRRYERVVYVSGAKTAPVYRAWPADVLPRARVHASVVAHVAAEHYCEHAPFHRIEQRLSRVGVELPRSSQVSLMRQLDGLVEPLVKAIKADVLGGGYVMVDATPVRVQDPERPGATREGTVWAYRNEAGTVWFDYAASKSPRHPDEVLREAQFCGLVQTDGAEGLGAIGPPGKVTSHGAWRTCGGIFSRRGRPGSRTPCHGWRGSTGCSIWTAWPGNSS